MRSITRISQSLFYRDPLAFCFNYIDATVMQKIRHAWSNLNKILNCNSIQSIMGFHGIFYQKGGVLSEFMCTSRKSGCTAMNMEVYVLKAPGDIYSSVSRPKLFSLYGVDACHYHTDLASRPPYNGHLLKTGEAPISPFNPTTEVYMHIRPDSVYLLCHRKSIEIVEDPTFIT